MSHTPVTSVASSSSDLRFQAIFEAALKSYQKQTKKDLLSHPLVSQLQDCNSTTAILVILQDQVREFDKSCSGDDRLTKWLGPTVNVLMAFSATIFSGVSLVLLRARPAHALSNGTSAKIINSPSILKTPVSETRRYSSSQRLHMSRASRLVSHSNKSIASI